MNLRHTLLSCCCLVAVAGALSAAESPILEEAPPAPRIYLGREIAETMHYLGAPWLTRESREREEDCTTMLKELKLKPGMLVCDMGCGNGLYTARMAKEVAAAGKPVDDKGSGKVLAVDIQPEMLALMRARMREQKLENYEAILGTFTDPKLPAGKVDLILCVDVYHEFSHPVQMLAAMRKSLAPKGQLVLVEFRAEDPKVPIKTLHKMSKVQINKEMAANGFKLARQFDELPWQHMMFFERDDAFVEPK